MLRICHFKLSLRPSFHSFDLYLRADLKMALGTVNNIIGRLRSVIKSALNDGLLRKDPFNGYTFDYPQIVPKFLSEKELEQNDEHSIAETEPQSCA